MSEQRLTVSELCRRWKVDAQRIERYVETGLLRAIDLPGGSYRCRRFKLSEVERFEAEHETMPAVSEKPEKVHYTAAERELFPEACR